MRPGYKLTDLGEIPVDWGAPQLSDLFDFSGGHSASRDQLGTHGVCYLHYGDIHKAHLPYLDVTLQRETMPKLPIALTDVSRSALLDHGDIVFVDASEDVEGTSKFVVVENPNRTPVISGLHTIVAKPRHRALSPIYQRFCFQTAAVRRQFRFYAVGTKVVGVSKSSIRKIRVLVPPAAEQDAIAEVLADIDSHVAAVAASLAKKRAIKQGAMQALLTGAKRLPGFSDAWEVARLGRVAEIAVGRTPPRSIESCWGSGFVWLTIGDLQGKRVSQSKEQITPSAASSMQIVKAGTLMMSFKLSIGRLCFAGCDLFTNEAICSFTSLRANAEFLYHALARTDFSLYGKQAVKGYTLNQESLRLIEVALPPPDEQAAIAEVLADMDADIDATTAKLAKARAIKQGMMQELLSGRIRLL